MVGAIVDMNMAIREARRRMDAARAAQEAEEARRAELATILEAEQRSIDLLMQGVRKLSILLANRKVPPDSRFSRRPHHDPANPADRFYVPAESRFVHWFTRTQPAWYLTTSAQWDAYVRLLGEADLRVAVLANGELSRTLRLSDREARVNLAQKIIELCALHELRWPVDGPDVGSLLELD
jgi:hypothetical protein